MKKVFLFTIFILSQWPSKGQAQNQVNLYDRAETYARNILSKDEQLIAIMQTLNETNLIPAREALMGFLNCKQIIALMPLTKALPGIQSSFENNQPLSPANIKLLSSIIESGVLKTLSDNQEEILRSLPDAIRKRIEALILDIQARIGRL